MNHPSLEALTLLEKEYDHACKKHPVFDQGNGPFFSVSILTEEAGEVAKALNDGNTQHAMKELAQTAAVCLRFIDFLRGEKKC